MQPNAKPSSTTDDLAADFAQLAKKSAKGTAGEGAVALQAPRPSLRGSLLKGADADPSDEQISTIANRVARRHNGFTAATVQPEKIEMERLSLFIPAATGHDLDMKAAKSRVTKTYLLLKALKDAGFDVPEAALVPDGRGRR